MKRIGNYDDKQGYSVFENTDKELVAKIKAVTVVEDENIIHDMFQGECEVINRISDSEILVKNKHGKHVIIKPLSSKEKLLTEINKQFYVGDYFTKNFGTIAYDGHIILGIKDVMPKNPYRTESYDEVSVASRYHERIDISAYNGFEFEYFKGYGSISCFFDENGNYVNRDYNLDLKIFKPCDPIEYKKNKIDEFIDQVSGSVPNELYFDEDKEVWFSKSFAYKLYIESEEFDISNSLKLMLDAIPNQGESYYHSGDSRNKIKQNKKCIEVNKDSLLGRLREKLSVIIR